METEQDTEMIHVETNYVLDVSTSVELPEGKTSADIADVWVKWGEVHVEFKDGTEVTAQETADCADGVDWKRPGSIEVRRDKEGIPDYETDPIMTGDSEFRELGIPVTVVEMVEEPQFAAGNKPQDNAGVQGVPEALLNYPREDTCRYCAGHVGTIMSAMGEIVALGICDDCSDLMVDWCEEVAAGNTVLGFKEWVEHTQEAQFNELK